MATKLYSYVLNALEKTALISMLCDLRAVKSFEGLIDEGSPCLCGGWGGGAALSEPGRELTEAPQSKRQEAELGPVASLSWGHSWASKLTARRDSTTLKCTAKDSWR